VKPPRFKYERPDSLAGAVEMLGRLGDGAKVLAGGQSLVAMMNLRLAAPEVLVDISRLDALRYVRVSPSAVEVGALTTQRAVEEDSSVARACPLLAEAVRQIGHAAIRNRGTIGGSVAHADPAAELPIVLAALGGEVTVASSAGERRIPASELFEGFLMTSIQPEEVLTEVSFPVNGYSGFAFQEFAQRPGDFALVAVACCVSGDRARAAIGGVGSVPAVVDGSGPDEVLEAAERIDPVSDIHATAEYRRHLIRRLTARAMRRALECA
jgi:CO/xanthine dehydrogenase FAD-binding subunit